MSKPPWHACGRWTQQEHLRWSCSGDGTAAYDVVATAPWLGGCFDARLETWSSHLKGTGGLATATTRMVTAVRINSFDKTNQLINS